MPVCRYERASPGELLHIDTKRLGRIQGVGHRITGQRQHRNRGIGWDAVHLAIDDHSRVSFARVLGDETALSCVQFLRQNGSLDSLKLSVRFGCSPKNCK